MLPTIWHIGEIDILGEALGLWGILQDPLEDLATHEKQSAMFAHETGARINPLLPTA